MSARKRKAKQPKPKTEWPCAIGTVAICGDIIQVCDKRDNEILALTLEEAGSLADALVEAFNAISTRDW